jgi:ATP-dependent Lon protease
VTRLALIPTRNAVVLPGAVTELAIGRPGSVAAVRHAVSAEESVLVVLQRDSHVEEPSQRELFEVGTVCRVTDAERASKDSAVVGVLGVERARILSVEKRGDALFATVEALEWAPTLPSLSEVVQLALPIVIEHGLRAQLSARTMAELKASTEFEQLCAASAIVPVSAEALQRVLESGDLAPVVEALESLRDQSWLGRFKRWLRGA